MPFRGNTLLPNLPIPIFVGRWNQLPINSPQNTTSWKLGLHAQRATEFHLNRHEAENGKFNEMTGAIVLVIKVQNQGKISRRMPQKSVALVCYVKFVLNILAFFGLVSSLNSVGSASQFRILLAPQMLDTCGGNSYLDLVYKFKLKIVFPHLRQCFMFFPFSSSRSKPRNVWSHWGCPYLDGSLEELPWELNL